MNKEKELEIENNFKEVTLEIIRRVYKDELKEAHNSALQKAQDINLEFNGTAITCLICGANRRFWIKGNCCYECYIEGLKKK